MARALCCLLVCSAFFGFHTSARAEEKALQDPAPKVLATIEAVMDLTIGQDPEVIVERVPQIRALMEESFALSAIVQRSFGKNWSRMSRTQQEEVMDMLGRIIISSYAKQLSAAKRPKMTVVSSKKIADQRYEMATVASIDGRGVNIVYRLAPIDDQWKVYDVMVENVSVVGNYRQQFDAFFQKYTADALLNLLRGKLTKAPQEKG